LACNTARVRPRSTPRSTTADRSVHALIEVDSQFEPFAT
jgi:hypothetical protein